MRNLCAFPAAGSSPRGNRTFTLGNPPWSGTRTRETNPPGLGERPRKGAYRANPGGVRAGGRGRGRGGPGRPMGPGRNLIPCDSIGRLLRLFLDQARSLTPSARNRAAVITWDFSADAPEKSKCPKWGGDRLKTAQGTLVSFLGHQFEKFEESFFTTKAEPGVGAAS